MGAIDTGLKNTSESASRPVLVLWKNDFTGSLTTPYNILLPTINTHFTPFTYKPYSSAGDNITDVCGWKGRESRDRRSGRGHCCCGVIEGQSDRKREQDPMNLDEPRPHFRKLISPSPLSEHKRERMEKILPPSLFLILFSLSFSVHILVFPYISPTLVDFVHSFMI